MAFESEKTKLCSMKSSRPPNTEVDQAKVDRCRTKDLGGDVLVGLFIGGQASRMGGLPKGLLEVGNTWDAAGRTDERMSTVPPEAAQGRASIVETLQRVVQHALPQASIVLVDRPNGEMMRRERPHALTPGDETRSVDKRLVGESYSALGLPIIEDSPAGIGPLGGLLSLCTEAQQRGCQWVVAIACDMPFVDEGVLRALIDVPAGQDAHAPYRDGRFEPLLSMYRVERVLGLAPTLLETRRHGLQDLLRALDAAQLSSDRYDGQALVDWDTPSDLPEDPQSA